MNIKQADGDIVREALNRSEYPDHRAVGTLDGEEVLLSARIDDGTPTLTAYAGGEYHLYDDMRDEYVGGESVRVRLDDVWSLDERFGELLRKHDLTLIEGVGADADCSPSTEDTDE